MGRKLPLIYTLVFLFLPSCRMSVLSLFSHKSTDLSSQAENTAPQIKTTISGISTKLVSKSPKNPNGKSPSSLPRIHSGDSEGAFIEDDPRQSVDARYKGAYDDDDNSYVP